MRITPKWIYQLYSKFFHLSRFLSNLRLPWKNRVALKIFIVLNILFTFRILEQLCVCPEKQRVPWIHCTKYIFFIIQDFSAARAWLEKQSCPEIFHCIEYTCYIQDIWATFACPEKQSCLGIFHCIEIFLSFRVFEQLALALKTDLPWKFSSPGGARRFGISEIWQGIAIDTNHSTTFTSAMGFDRFARTVDGIVLVCLLRLW